MEPWAFWILVAIHLIPILSTHWFVTLDGPSHLYSARIVRDLLLGDPFMGRFFHLSGYPVPYWTGHALMAGLLTVFPAWVVEKLMWSTAVIGLAGAFRYFMHSIAPARSWAPLLVMPFLLHYALRLGFLNFSISISLFLVVIAMAWRSLTDARENTALHALLLLLLYFTHLFTFMLCTGILLAMLSWAFLCRHVPGPSAVSPVVGKLLLALIVPLALAGVYIFNQPAGPMNMASLTTGDLWRWIVEGRAWNGLGATGEKLACTLTAVPMLIMGIMALLVRVARPKALFIRMSDLWLLLTLISFTAYFIIPDVVAGGSSVSPRLLLFSMLFLTGALAVSRLPSWAVRLAVALVVLADLQHTRIQYDTAVSLGQECTELMSLEGSIEDKTVLLSLNYGGNWMHSNIASYLGTGEARVIVLDHFTALAPFNPEQWNKGMLPYGAVGDFAQSTRPCVRLSGYRDSTGTDIDAVLTWKTNSVQNEDSCLTDLRAQLSAAYFLIASSPHGDAQLFGQR